MNNTRKQIWPSTGTTATYVDIVTVYPINEKGDINFKAKNSSIKFLIIIKTWTVIPNNQMRVMQGSVCKNPGIRDMSNVACIKVALQTKCLD